MEIAAAISPLQIILQPMTTVVAKVATPAPPIHRDQGEDSGTSDVEQETSGEKVYSDFDERLMLVEQITNKVNQDFALVGMPALERKGARSFFH